MPVPSSLKQPFTDLPIERLRRVLPEGSSEMRLHPVVIDNSQRDSGS
jgi:hypothetical protein